MSMYKRKRKFFNRFTITWHWPSEWKYPDRYWACEKYAHKETGYSLYAYVRIAGLEVRHVGPRAYSFEKCSPIEIKE